MFDFYMMPHYNLLNIYYLYFGVSEVSAKKVYQSGGVGEICMLYLYKIQIYNALELQRFLNIEGVR